MPCLKMFCSIWIKGLIITLFFNLEGFGQADSYTGEVLPKPQTVLTKWSFVYVNPNKFNVRIDNDSDKISHLAKKLLLERMKEVGIRGKVASDAPEVTILLGQLDSLASKKIIKDVKMSISQGYAIRVFPTADKILIAGGGVDDRGIFYAAMTLLQQIGTENGLLGIKVADLNDWPEWQHRYVSDYGPITKKQMIYLAENKINGYAIQHRMEWREFASETPIPGPLGTYGQALKAIKEFKSENDLLDFMLVINIYSASPRKYPWFDITNEKDVAGLINVCKLAQENGIQHVMIGMDDWTPTENNRFVCPNLTERKKFNDSVGKAHQYLMYRLHEAMKKYPNFELSIVPPVYSLVSHKAEEPQNRAYLKDLSFGLPNDIFIVWTGPRIVSPQITHEDYVKFSRLVGGHKLFLWDNSECINCPLPIWRTNLYKGFSKDSYSIIYLNLHAFGWIWDKPYVININDYLWNPNSYNATDSYRNAVAKVFNQNAFEPAVTYTTNYEVLMKTSDSKKKKELLVKMETAISALDKLNLDTSKAKSTNKGIRSEMNVKVPEVTIHLFKNAPIIDGNPSTDSQWEKATTFSLVTNSEKQDSVDPAEVKIGYDKQNLYYAFVLYHKKTLPTPVFRSSHDDNVYESSDAIELFIQPENGSNYAHLVFDFKGNRFDELGSVGPGGWDPDWTVKVKAYEKYWTAEVVIPFLSLQRLTQESPAEGDVWKMNIIRDYNINHQSIAWSSTEGYSFHNTNFFGKMIFKK